MVPSEMISAWSSVTTYATAIDALWTSKPMESVRDWCLADLRVWCLPVGDRMRFSSREATPRCNRGQPTYRKSLCLGARGAEGKDHTIYPPKGLDESNPLDYLLVHAYCRGITRISSPSG